MHVLRKDGDSIAALAMIVVDNPMLPGTGHRICNDCMKGCVFQKQEPVNIPQAETGVLTDVLGMRWGFEIYGLLTRWNPLNRDAPGRAPVHRQERAGRRARARPASRCRTTCSTPASASSASTASRSSRCRRI